MLLRTNSLARLLAHELTHHWYEVAAAVLIDAGSIFVDMTITPDEKDWTWVLEQACDECGCDTTGIAGSDVAALLRTNAAHWTEILSGNPDELRRRPAPQTWSALEYGCHVRDVFEKFGERLRLMLNENDPVFDNWDQDQSALDNHYDRQDPATLGAELAAAATRTTATLDGIADEHWQRVGRRSNGSLFTVASLSRYLLHDPVHHLYDVTGKRYAEQA